MFTATIVHKNVEKMFERRYTDSDVNGELQGKANENVHQFKK